MRNYNILFCSTPPFIPTKGGIERVTDILYKEFEKRGHRVYYLTLNPCPESFLSTYNKNNFILPSTIIEDRINKIEYLNFLKDNKIDVIINQYGLSLRESSFFLDTADLNVQKISVLHSNPLQIYHHLFRCFVQNKERKLLKRIFWLFMFPFQKKKYLATKSKTYDYVQNNSNKIILLSEQFIEEVKIIDPIYDKNKIKIIPNPNTYASEDIPIKGKEKIILFIGRLDKIEKSPDRLLEIWKRIPDHKGWKLLFIGDGPAKDSLIHEIKKYNIMDVELLGTRDPQDYYKKASILCMTSTIEGFAMVISEAMINKCVPILFDILPKNDNRLLQNETCILVPPFDIDIFRQELFSLMQNDKKRENMADSAYSNIRNYDVSKIASIWEDIFAN